MSIHGKDYLPNTAKLRKKFQRSFFFLNDICEACEASEAVHKARSVFVIQRICLKIWIRK